MNKIIVEGINKEERLKFKNGTKNIIPAIVLFNKNTATIIINEPYNITEEYLISKSKFMKEIREYIINFRNIQFNQ